MAAKSLKAVNNEKATQLLNDLMDEIVPAEDFMDDSFMQAIPEELWGRITYRQVMLRRLMSKACKGDNKAIQEILDRTLGKPVQKNENINLEASYTEFLDAIGEEELRIPTESLITSIKDDDADEPLPIHQAVLDKRIADLI